MKTAVVTDSNSGITQEEAKNEGIFILPMPVIVDGVTRYEGQDLTQEMFYGSLTGGIDVTTSQPSPGDVMDLWDKVLSGGYEELVYIPMSSGLSNSCETAILLSDDYDGKVQVVDNHRISVTQREAVMEAVRLVAAGTSAKAVKEDLEARAYDSSIYITVDTLEYLKKGGRVTPAGAAIGAVLNIKPVLTIQGERLDAFAKVRGMRKGKDKMIEALKKDIEERFSEMDRSRIRIGTAGAGLTAAEAEEWCSEVEKAFPWAEVYYNPLSMCIATHTGPGAIGIGFSIVK